MGVKWKNIQKPIFGFKGIFQILHRQKKSEKWERGAVVGMQKIQKSEKIVFESVLACCALFLIIMG